MSGAMYTIKQICCNYKEKSPFSEPLKITELNL